MQPCHRRNWWYAANWITTHPCVDCGETNGMLLEFDHRDPKEKKMGISQAVWKMGFENFKKEIEKCDIRCANDHKRRHYKENLQCTAME